MHLQVLLGTEDNSVIVVDENRLEDQHLQDRIGAPVTKMAVAPNGRFLACHQKDGVLTVMSTTFTTKVLDFDTKSTTRPMEITWCGEDAVVLVWRNTGLVMVGPYGDWLNFQYDGAVRLVPEADCCRIITSTGCELLQRVPASTVAIRRIGSTDPGALIYDAMEAFEEGDPKSGENIRSIAASDQLIGAIKSCISAAACEFDVSKQQSLMKAASYGKSFSADADPTEFVETAKKLRVLNEIRKPLIGMPLTMHQLTRLTLDVLISRLTLRNHHLLALRICDLLKLKNENVLTHWGCEKVTKTILY
jgi:vacuolar protein sorting-associated protein 16